MSQRNTPQRTLESWKQIAAYLDRSERTVRRWESNEGLPVHRRGHQKLDAVCAYKHELDSWRKLRTRTPEIAARADDFAPVPEAVNNGYLAEHDEITRTIHCYVAGARAGPIWPRWLWA